MKPENALCIARRCFDKLSMTEKTSEKRVHEEEKAKRKRAKRGNRMNVLLTSVGCMGYVGLIKAFQKEECKVFGVDCSSDAVGFSFCDGSAVVPHGDNEAYTTELLKVCINCAFF